MMHHKQTMNDQVLSWLIILKKIPVLLIETLCNMLYYETQNGKKISSDKFLYHTFLNDKIIGSLVFELRLGLNVTPALLS